MSETASSPLPIGHTSLGLVVALQPNGNRIDYLLSILAFVPSIPILLHLLDLKKPEPEVALEFRDPCQLNQFLLGVFSVK